MPFYWFKGLPDCSYDLETLENIVLERYQAYNNPNNSCEYDFNVNSIDSVGHLFICIIANQAEELKPLILKGELKLFINRLESRSVEKIKNDFSLLLDVLNFDKSELNLEGKNRLRFIIIEKILKTISARIDHVFDVNHKETCHKFKITLPFYIPLSLIAKREIEVKNGFAAIYCSKWKILLEDIFEFLLQVEIAVVNNCGVIKKQLDETEDDRVRQIIQRSVNAFATNPSNHFILSNRDVIDEESQFFPPCMANLHQILRRTHRLSYDSRYQYTLFLKDAGLNLKENILFWEEEYSKPHCSSQCTHHWEEKKKRYMYQIRHIYGLTGAFTKKTSHPCDKFKGMLSFKMDGGCPFVHFSKNELINSLPFSSACPEDIEDILNFKDSNQPEKACAAYLGYQENILRRKKNLKKINHIGKINHINKPIDYYFSAKNISLRLKEKNCDQWL